MQDDIPRFSVGDRVCMTTDEQILADLFTKHKDLSQYYSMVIRYFILVLLLSSHTDFITFVISIIHV